MGILRHVGKGQNIPSLCALQANLLGQCLSLPSKNDGLWLCLNRNLHFGTGIQVDLLAAPVSQGILNADHLMVVIRSFDRNLCFLWFARNNGFNNGFNRSG
jgi:hypothetical protein